ncbi:MAG TPA: nucleoside triphosphate pyrophosphatase [Steroidobacteraceae bacterium]|nr:nucleoside triphosphate pyrophosphatase [Steroidobacteraceae bacterium]
MSPAELILASTSSYRRELLSRLRLPFTTAAPGVDESPAPHQTPLERAQRLALEKAMAVAANHPDATVIGSDQVAVCKGELLEKPGSAQRCREQLHWLSAAAATFYTAVAVLQHGRGQTLQFVDTTTVYFRALSEPEIERYIAAEQPFDCAGGFRCEGLGIALFARVVSEDPTALIGLPLIAVARALRQLGHEIP